MLESEKCY